MSKESKPDTWMPLVIGDYLKDTARLTTEQHGAYMLLIMNYWVEGPPKDDDDDLASITKMDAKKWQKNREKLARFFVIENGVWRQKRIDAELARWTEKKAKYVERASAGGRAKAAKSSASSTPQAPRKHGKTPKKSCLKSAPQPASTVERANNVALSHSERGRADERPDGASSLRAWPGPVDFRDAVVARLGEDFARSWLDPTGWQDVPSRAIICKIRFTADRLRRDLRKLLTEHGIEVRIEQAA